MKDIIIAIVIVGAIGLIFGCLLAFASVIFKVEKDEREEKITDALPGANCGACGFAGCSSYASAIVNEGAPVNCCSVGKSPVAAKIAEIMGVQSETVEEKTAVVRCVGGCGVATVKYEYDGPADCRSAVRLGGGTKECPTGCVGLGSCVAACKFGALSIVDGIAVVDPDKCTACGMCAKQCPKHLIEIIPKKNLYFVSCINNEKGALTNKYCKSGCIGCKKCEKSCEFSAITVDNNVAKIDYSLCQNCGNCIEQCPKGIIRTRETKNIAG